MGDTDYWELVQKLVVQGVVTREKWFAHDPAEYLFYARGRRPGYNVRLFLRDVLYHMCWTRTLADYLIRPCALTPEEIQENSVFAVLAANGYDPLRAGAAILHWANRSSPRNTLWVCGESVSGALDLCHCLVYSSPVLGIAECHSRKNPFRIMNPCMLYWWQGGRVLEDAVPLCKEIFAGAYVTLREGGREEEYFRTPVLIYSTGADMTSVKKGTQSLDEYREGLRDCMYRLNLTRLYPLERPMTTEDMGVFLWWVKCSGAEASDCHELK